ncbi:MAG: hypothetical protein HRU80_08365 [Ignavibacteriales bacterium]|nr:hypothetical protein [Ignavibacteriaceae bacterium]MCK6613250.1 hypothetical protein [Ignavibacteriaceae bacterium]QOJ28897.1 MAG: hypothetical protein HRU80_08365 [Ignavibacteriales bacterium]
MFTTNRFAAFVLMLAFLFTSVSVAQDKKPKEENKKSNETVTVPANTIDFKAQLKSSNSSLDNLGAMIENGRKKAEVNTLIAAAMILFLEEGATKSKAQITGNDLLKEATELATKQKNVNALKTLQGIWENSMLGNDKNKSKDLGATISSVEAELASTRGPGAKVVDVKVENYTNYTIYVYIDGVYQGYLNSGYYVVYNNVGTGWTDFYAETDNIWSSSQGKYIYYYWSNSYNLTNYDYTYATDFTWSVY